MLGSYEVGLFKEKKNLSQARRGSNHLGGTGGEKGGGETGGQTSDRRLGWVGDSRRQAKEVEMVWPHPLRSDRWLHLLCSPFLSLEAAPILLHINGKSAISSSRQPGLQAGMPERRGTLPPPCLAYRGLLAVLHAMPGV